MVLQNLTPLKRPMSRQQPC